MSNTGSHTAHPREAPTLLAFLCLAAPGPLYVRVFSYAASAVPESWLPSTW